MPQNSKIELILREPYPGHSLLDGFLSFSCAKRDFWCAYQRSQSELSAPRASTKQQPPAIIDWESGSHSW